MDSVDFSGFGGLGFRDPSYEKYMERIKYCQFFGGCDILYYVKVSLIIKCEFTPSTVHGN